MTKTKRILLFAVMISFTVVCLFATFTAAYAEETTAPEQVTEEPQNEPQNDDNEATEPPTTEPTEDEIIKSLRLVIIEELINQVGQDYYNHYDQSKSVWENIKVNASTEIFPSLDKNQIKIWETFVLQFDNEIETFKKSTENSEQTDTAFDMAALVEKFTAYLKDKYGAEYEQIYNGIIEQWGSIEAYLVQFGEEYIPEEFNAGWGDFVEWLGVNAPIWATALALACVIFIAVFGKKAFDKIVNKIVDAKVSVLSAELNKQSAAISAQMKALKTIMPTTEKGAAAVQELDAKEKELTQ